MYRITAPRAFSTSTSSRPPVVVLAVLLIVALSLLAFYIHVLQDQVQRGERFRAELQQSGRGVATARSPRDTPQMVATRQ